MQWKRSLVLCLLVALACLSCKHSTGGQTSGGAAGEPASQIQPPKDPPGVDEIIGNYSTKALKGGGEGRLVVWPAEDGGVLVELKIANDSAGGEIVKGPATYKDGVATFTGQKGTSKPCTLSICFDLVSARVVEDDCGYYRGAKISFDGTYAKE